MSSKPTISATAPREDVLKFIKENKIQIKVTEVVDGKKKKRSVKALREELNKLGYAVTGDEKTKGFAPTTLKGMRKAQERKEETGIQIQGFSSETQPVAPQVSGQEVELMGALSGKLSAEQEVIYKNLPNADTMRGYLITRLPRTSFIGIPLRQLKLLYMSEQARDNEELFAPQYKDLPPLPEIKSYLREQLPSVNIDTLTLVGIKELYIKTKPKVDEALRIKAEEEEERRTQQMIADREAKEKAERKAERAAQKAKDKIKAQIDPDDIEEDPGYLTEVMFEGKLYWENEETGKIYLDEEGTKFIGVWNEDYDEIIFREGIAIEKPKAVRPDTDEDTDEDEEPELSEYYSSAENLEELRQKYLDVRRKLAYRVGGDTQVPEELKIAWRDARRKMGFVVNDDFSVPEPEPEPEEGLTEEEIETLIELAGDTSRYLPVRKEAWRQLRDAGINISEPTKKPKPKPKLGPATLLPGTETLDTDDDTDEEPEVDTTSEEEEDPEQWTDFEYEGVSYSYQDGMVYDESLNPIGEAKIKNRMFIKWTDKVKEYHRRKVAAIADPDNEDDSIDYTDMWKYTGELENFDDDL